MLNHHPYYTLTNNYASWTKFGQIIDIYSQSFFVENYNDEVDKYLFASRLFELYLYHLDDIQKFSFLTPYLKKDHLNWVLYNIFLWSASTIDRKPLEVILYVFHRLIWSNSKIKEFENDNELVTQATVIWPFNRLKIRLYLK
jgi:hypothetical protein